MEVLDDALVGGRICVMKLVNDNDIKLIGLKAAQSTGIEGLDRGKNVLAPSGLISVHHELAEGARA
ncbi:hypothetical protein GCM10011374_06960 [Kocuria dechangensis]|uniref:Uncharacterized protein n=1 Tax=Kocuria dechangensis TaxID=1176249 RepID=A0A917LNR4_9MICC|nr:hypothetical protein GCM10011374_06960 [Kocuria dechangensis]